MAIIGKILESSQDYRHNEMAGMAEMADTGHDKTKNQAGESPC